jgi:hypothetical protein
VGPFAELAARFPDAEVAGDDHGVVLPGLVNAHTHLSEGLLCGMGEDLTLLEWIGRDRRPGRARHLTREMAMARGHAQGRRAAAVRGHLRQRHVLPHQPGLAGQPRGGRRPGGDGPAGGGRLRGRGRRRRPAGGERAAEHQAPGRALRGQRPGRVPLGVGTVLGRATSCWPPRPPRPAQRLGRPHPPGRGQGGGGGGPPAVGGDHQSAGRRGRAARGPAAGRPLHLGRPGRDRDLARAGARWSTTRWPT